MTHHPSPRPTPLTDALEDHGSQYYNAPRYKVKMLKHARQLERDRAELIEASKALCDWFMARTGQPNEVYELRALLARLTEQGK